MFSYYGIAASTVLSTLNYLLLGLALNVDGFCMHSFNIWLTCMVVFPAAGNLGTQSSSTGWTGGVSLARQ
jgi:hypothetical protein